MASEGDVVKKSFIKIASEKRARPSRVDVPLSSIKECCFELPALFDSASGVDYYRNDQHKLIEKFDKETFPSVIIALEKYENGSWTEKDTFTDDTYGTNYAYGELGSTDETLFYIGYNVEFRKIFVAFGEGSYRFNFKSTRFDAVLQEELYPFSFCVKEYTENRANATTRFDWYTAGFRGNRDFDDDVWDFVEPAANDEKGSDEGWFNQIRLPDSVFHNPRSEYTKEYVKYANGELQYLEDVQIERYDWNGGQYPAELHNYLRVELAQSDTLYVTDYNKDNPNVYKDKAVKMDSNYEPEWQYKRLKAFVNLEFIQAIQNHTKHRC